MRLRMIKEFNPRGICGGHLWTLRMRMRKILNPIFKYLNSFFGLNWLNEDEKDFEPNILKGRHRNWPLILTLQLLWEASCWPLSQPPLTKAPRCLCLYTRKKIIRMVLIDWTFELRGPCYLGGKVQRSSQLRPSVWSSFKGSIWHRTGGRHLVDL